MEILTISNHKILKILKFSKTLIQTVNAMISRHFSILSVIAHCDENNSKHQHTLSNWSGTKHITLPSESHVMFPKTTPQLSKILKQCTSNSKAVRASIPSPSYKPPRCRVVGNMLSPNGIAFVDNVKSSEYSIPTYGGSNSSDSVNATSNPFDRVISLQDMKFELQARDPTTITIPIRDDLNGNVLKITKQIEKVLVSCPPSVTIQTLLETLKVSERAL